MNTSKHLLLVAAFVLLASLGSAMAQGKMDRKGAAIMPPEPIQPTVHVNAIEVTDGNIGYDIEKRETMFGYSFLGRTSGSFPGSFTLSMNCTPAIPIPSDSTQLTGGAWTLPVYKASFNGASYAGSLYGSIVNGKMNWDKTGTSADVYFDLNIEGGTQSWERVQGSATFVGFLSFDEKTQKTTLTGDLVFRFNEFTTK